MTVSSLLSVHAWLFVAVSMTRRTITIMFKIAPSHQTVMTTATTTPTPAPATMDAAKTAREEVLAVAALWGLVPLHTVQAVLAFALGIYDCSYLRH